MVRAKTGDRVTVSYIGTLDNGHIFDNTEEGKPLTFTVGAGEVFPRLEEAVVGMAPGEVKNVVIPAAEAYGPRRKENVLTVRRQSLPAERELQVGQKLQVSLASGRELLVRVVVVSGDKVTLDANHALAGLELTFALRLDAVA